MIEFEPTCMLLCVVIATYLLHSSIVLLACKAVLDYTKLFVNSELRVLVWKLSLLLPVVTTIAVTALELPHLGMRVPVAVAASTEARELSASAVDTADAKSSSLPNGQAAITTAATVDLGTRQSVPYQERFAMESVESHAFSWSSSLVSQVDRPLMSVIAVFIWLMVVVCGLFRLSAQIWQLKQLRGDARIISDGELFAALDRVRNELRIRRRVALLQSQQVRGPMTAGFVSPCVIVPVGMRCDDPTQRDALLAHELTHVARYDALWNLVVQLLCRVFPFQPLNVTVGRQLRREMDFVADAGAARTPEARIGLARSLLQFGDQLTAESATTVDPGLAACMASFDSLLGKRIEVLLSTDCVLRRSNVSGRLAVVSCMLVASAVVAISVPRAVVSRPMNPELTNPTLLNSSRKHAMNKNVSAIALIATLAMPAVADEPEVQTVQARAVAPLKASADPLPSGMRGFNGMLVGRLASKDVEKGTFLVQVDAVPRVWRNSKAENPKSIVGKAVEVSGVFGRFLDVLVVTRKGETLEFECKHDGDGLVFPGELLRKVAAYDPADYPELPEAFRGFQGNVIGTVIKKDPETFELIVKIDRVANTWKGNAAKEPKSIEGKSLMLAGFWNRKEAYHKLKIGDKIEAGMKHIGMRSEHMTVAEAVRSSSAGADREMMKRESGSEVVDGMSRELRGFRGMLVGRLVEKDVERGTFAITVDAVPRVWNNNKASKPKSLLGTKVIAGGVAGRLLDTLVVSKKGDTLEFGALHEGGERMRVVEVLRKVGPVKPGDYPVLPDDFRGFRGIIRAKVVRKDDHMLGMTVEITDVKSTFAGSQAERPEAIRGKRATLAGFWKRKDAFHSIEAGDTILCGVEHPQRLSDHLSVIESFRKVED